MKPRSAAFDYPTHHFRALAILAVMACHFCAMTNHDEVNRVFFTAATHFFLFISGYLCQFLHTKKPQAPLEYYRKKVVNVLSPYVLFTLALTYTTTSASTSIVHNLFYGSAQAPYWYIPFVMTLFLISPLLCRLARLPMLALLGVTFVASIIFPERQFPLTWAWPAVAHLYVYFVPYYLLGFVYAREKAFIDSVIAKFRFVIIACALALYLLIIRYPFSTHLDFAISLQRLMMIGVALYVLNKFKSLRSPFLDRLATTSFTLYFMHDIYFHGALKLLPKAYRNGYTESVVFVLAVLSLVYIADFLRLKLGKYSRPLIGS